jgi:hypothetical protein
MKRFIVRCTTAAMLLALVSCAGSASSAHSARGHATYLANNKSEIAFVQWQNTTGGHARGTLTVDSIGGAAPAASLSVNSVPFTGTVHGTSVDLTFAHGLFLQGHALGRLTGSSLTLAVPHADGAIHRMTFTQASRSSYNSAVAALRRSAQHENLLAAGADIHPSANSRADQHNTQMDLTSLYQASSLAPQAKLTHDVDRFARDTATARSRLATEKHDASGDNHYCAATLTVVGDSRGVNGALLSAVGDSESLTADITAIQIDIRAADADLRRLSRAGLPGPTSAPALIATAKVSMARAIASANSQIDQMNGINNQARVMANRMATGKCSAPGQTALTPPVGHIK